MAYGIFSYRSDSKYQDSPAEVYQFPLQYFARVSACIDDWVIYYGPGKGNSARGYFAVARVTRVMPDRLRQGMFVACIEPQSYLEFSRPVPFKLHDAVVERGLLNAEGRLSGRAQSAVRVLSADDFHRITSLGMRDDDWVLPRSDVMENPTYSGFAEEQASYELRADRHRIASFTSRAVRDRVFRRIVLEAYDKRCALTGLKFVNGGGRAEVVAAHIRPVEANGPDTVINGLALSGTAHWMFDRGLVSLSDDLNILISRQANDKDGIRSFIDKDGRALAPKKPFQMPSAVYLDWHRRHCFKH